MKETLLNLKGIIPIMKISEATLGDKTAFAEFLEFNGRAFDEILQMSHYLTLDIGEEFGEAPAIEIKEIQPSEIDQDQSVTYGTIPDGRIIQFSVITQYDPTSIGEQFDEESLKALGRTGLIGLANDVMAGELQKRIMNLFLAANIAKPGSIGFETGMIYLNGHFHSQLDYFNCDYLKHEDFELESAARLRELPIRKVWDWFDSLEGTEMSIASGPVGRAIGALSYAFGPGSSHLWPQIVWALLGLESLYAPKGQLQKYQLTTNIPKLLGKKAVVEELIDQLYEMRLKFMHGAADFPFAYNELNELFSMDDDNEQFFKAQNYAIVLLIASLQQLAETGQTALPFAEED